MAKKIALIRVLHGFSSRAFWYDPVDMIAEAKQLIESNKKI